MDVYFLPIKVAFITFPFLALLFTFPFAIYQYKKYGYINKFRVFILYSFLLYLIAAYYLVILPLPRVRDLKSLQVPGTRHFSLIPFTFIKDLMKETRVVIDVPSTYKNLLTERAFLQAIFNAVLLTPLGIYLRYYFKKDLKKTIVITFCVSLFFEITQITGIFGIYNAPYRLFDVDDLFLNTLGGYIGYLISPIFTFFLPSREELDVELSAEKIRITYFRRFLSYLVDMFLISLIPNVKESILLEALIFFIYFIVIVYFTNGLTIGKWLMNIKVKGQKDRLKFKEAFIRYGILYLGIFSGNKFLTAISNLNQHTDFNYGLVIIVMLQLLISFLIGVHFLLCVLKKNRFFYEKISYTSIVILKNKKNV